MREGGGVRSKEGGRAAQERETRWRDRGSERQEEGERRQGPESQRERQVRQEERDPEGKASKAVREVCEREK